MNNDRDEMINKPFDATTHEKEQILRRALELAAREVNIGKVTDAERYFNDDENNWYVDCPEYAFRDSLVDFAFERIQAETAALREQVAELEAFVRSLRFCELSNADYPHLEGQYRHGEFQFRTVRGVEAAGKDALEAFAAMEGKG